MREARSLGQLREGCSSVDVLAEGGSAASGRGRQWGETHREGFPSTGGGSRAPARPHTEGGAITLPEARLWGGDCSRPRRDGIGIPDLRGSGGAFDAGGCYGEGRCDLLYVARYRRRLGGGDLGDYHRAEGTEERVGRGGRGGVRQPLDEGAGRAAPAGGLAA
ncbi:uncharacterized protein M6B38_150085 [Iris pallida]|uniref:Uncharacterized protein n=1 Tax=Iris pallida TaxID=29817 RepID=A0AAX6DPW4_IRIPA|nr:Uncharacterized protein M6B38_235550 [Iris pallida]KAJ6812165.1 uncharacterized protein M6B38_150085 [Iris pallida]